MRRLKTILADGKPYTLSTLTLREQTYARKFEQLPKEQRDVLESLTEKSSDENTELTPEEMEQMNNLQDKQIDNMLKIVMLALAKCHEEFKVKEGQGEEVVLEKIKDLIDLRDMRRFATFALLGSLPPDEEEEYEVDEMIDLTEGMDIG